MKAEVLLALMRRAVREDLGRVEPRAWPYSRVAKHLGIGQPRVNVLVRSGVLLSAPVGRSRMVPLSEIERLTHRPIHRS